MLRNKFIYLFLFAFFAVSAPVAAMADITLTTAKEQGFVGERSDGLLGLVDSAAPEETRRLVTTINQKRLERYNSIAQKNGTPVEQVQLLAAKRLIAETPAGQYIQMPDGKWIRK